MVIPTITPELAAQAPNPELAWTLRPEKETEPLFTPTENGSWDVDFSLPVTTDTMIYWEAK